MMRDGALRVAAGLTFGLLLAGCATSDSTGLSAGSPEAQISLQSSRTETFTDTEVRVAVTDGGMPLGMQRGSIEVEHGSGGYSRTFDMDVRGDTLSSRMMFFEPGQYRLRFRGMPMGDGMMNGMMRDMGSQVIEVHRNHHVVGDYWVEFELDPAPVLENGTATIRVFIFDLTPDLSAGAPAAGLDVGMAIYDPTEVETTLTVGETAVGVYEAEYTFGAAGLYELLVDIGSTDPVTGDFYIPVLTDLDDDGLGFNDHHGGWWHHGGHNAVIGNYQVDLDVDPVPVPENGSAGIRLNIFSLDQGGIPVGPAEGLDVAMTIHDPANNETGLVVNETSPGLYEAQHTFGAAGLYELYVEIGSTDPVTDEFHIPVGSWQEGNHDCFGRGGMGGHSGMGGGC